MAELRAVILAATVVLLIGPVLAWRRRDNILMYLQGGTLIATFAIPLLGTNLLNTYDRAVVETYALLLSIGAVAFLVGLAYGIYVGNRSGLRLPLTFTRPVADNEIDVDARFLLVARRIRIMAVVALVALMAGFALLGYVPILAAVRQWAKYGIGPYAAGFARARFVYLFALTFGSVVLPAVLVLSVRTRRLADLALAGGILVGLLCSLSRGLALLGPIAVVVALAVERKLHPVLIVAGVAMAFLAGIVFNELTVGHGAGQQPSFATQALQSAPDLADHLNFLRGYEAQGRPETHGSTILANLSPSRGEDGSSFALRMATGILDLSQLAAGGLRLPGPIWGYASFGLWGAALWAFLSGVVAGWGSTKFKRLLRPTLGQPGQAMNLVIAYIVYNGTFGSLQEFYFPTTAKFVVFLVAIALGVYATLPLRAPSTRPRLARAPAPLG